MTDLLQSWVQSANNATSPYPLNNLPYGVFSTEGGDPRCGVAIGDMIIDVQALERAGIITLPSIAFDGSDWNAFMALGKDVWALFRARMTDLLAAGGDDALSGNDGLKGSAMVAAADATMHMPITSCRIY